MTRIPTLAATQTIDDCRARLQALYAASPHVLISLSLSHTRVVQDTKATIIGVYPHVFCVEEHSCGVPQRHTFSYADLLTGRVSVRPAE